MLLLRFADIFIHDKLQIAHDCIMIRDDSIRGFHNLLLLHFLKFLDELSVF